MTNTGGAPMDTKYSTVFSKNLKIFLERFGMSQADLADNLNISRSTVCQWLSGQRTPRPAMLDLVCSYFHCSRAELMDENPIPRSYQVINDRFRLLTPEQQSVIGDMIDAYATRNQYA